MSIIEILKKEGPDYKLELLWIDFKKNFNSFKQKYQININLDDQSKKLNELKDNKSYQLIGEIIKNNLVSYAKLSIKHNDIFNKLLCYKHMKILNKIYNVDHDFLKLMKSLHINSNKF